MSGAAHGNYKSPAASRQSPDAGCQYVKVMQSLSLFFRETKKEGEPPQVVGDVISEFSSESWHKYKNCNYANKNGSEAYNCRNRDGEFTK